MSDDPELRRLTDTAAEALLVRALDDGEELVSWRVRQVDHRPGSSTTVAYSARVRTRDGEHRQVLAASCRPGAEDVAVWRFPLDPGLPALVTAVDEQAVRALLTSHGIAPGPVRLDVRSYRPRRRAVVEVHAPGRRLFLKVLRPRAAAALHERHRLLRGAGLPVPRSLGCSEQGLLVLEALEGATLRTRLREQSREVPDAADLVSLLDRLPPEVRDLPARRSWTDEVAHYARVTASALPSEAARCEQLSAAVQARVDPAPGREPTHGDFYETQLLVDRGRVTGLLDVDTAGPGRRTDDLACLLAHVDVLAQLEPAHGDATRALGARWLAELERAVDPVELRARVAGVVVSLATGPHRVQQEGWQDATRARLDLAEQWLAPGRQSGAVAT